MEATRWKMGRQEVNAQRCQESMFVLEGFQESLWHCMELELVCQSGWNLHMVHTLANIMALHFLCVGTTWELSWLGGKQRVWVHHGRISQTLTIHQSNLTALSDNGIECSIFSFELFDFWVQGFEIVLSATTVTVVESLGNTNMLGSQHANLINKDQWHWVWLVAKGTTIKGANICILVKGVSSI